MEPLFEKLKKEGIANPQRLVLPESTEERNMIAADRMLAEGTGKITFIGKKERNHRQSQRDEFAKHL